MDQKEKIKKETKDNEEDLMFYIMWFQSQKIPH